MSESRAVHKDDGKPQLSLIDPLFLREIGKALTLPTVSGKYAPHNWRNGIEVSRLLNSTLRHVNDFNDGIDNDVETGVSHLAHAACNLMFALRMLKDRPDLDDRYKKEAPVAAVPMSVEREIKVVDLPPLPEYDDEGNWRYYR